MITHVNTYNILSDKRKKFIEISFNKLFYMSKMRKYRCYSYQSLRAIKVWGTKR